MYNIIFFNSFKSLEFKLLLIVLILLKKYFEFFLIFSFLIKSHILYNFFPLINDNDFILIIFDIFFQLYNFFISIFLI